MLIFKIYANKFWPLYSSPRRAERDSGSAIPDQPTPYAGLHFLFTGQFAGW
jgi:hypothetical protein